MTPPSDFVTRIERDFRKAAGFSDTVPVRVEIIDDASVYVIIGHRNIFIGEVFPDGRFVFISADRTVTFIVPRDYPAAAA